MRGSADCEKWKSHHHIKDSPGVVVRTNARDARRLCLCEKGVDSAAADELVNEVGLAEVPVMSGQQSWLQRRKDHTADRDRSEIRETVKKGKIVTPFPPHT